MCGESRKHGSAGGQGFLRDRLPYPAFDALALMAAGIPRVVAIFGVHGWRWDWVREVRELVLALDADAAGQQQWRPLARQATLRGKRVAVLAPAAYGGYKDMNEAWMAGVLTIGAWPTAEAAGAEGPRLRPARGEGARCTLRSAPAHRCWL